MGDVELGQLIIDRSSCQMMKKIYLVIERTLKSVGLDHCIDIPQWLYMHCARLPGHKLATLAIKQFSVYITLSLSF